jgi:hypothetical protein
MKFSLESLKAASEKSLNTIDFKRKNEFFYNNAYTIIKSNEMFNGNNYLDVLETINSNYEKKNKRKKKIVMKVKENNVTDDGKNLIPITQSVMEKKTNPENIENNNENLKLKNKILKGNFK